MRAGTTDRQVQYGRILGLGFVVLGFLAIGLGWNGMARKACPDCQLPYLLSGGAVGLGLIFLGGALLVMAQIRMERMRLTERLERWGSSTGGSSPAAVADGQFLAGQSTYHRPGCRLVKGKTDVQVVSLEGAKAQGLSACRVCRPPEPAAEGSPTAT